MKKKMKKKMKELKTYVDLFKMIFCTIVFVNLYEQMKEVTLITQLFIVLVDHSKCYMLILLI